MAFGYHGFTHVSWRLIVIEMMALYLSVRSYSGVYATWEIHSGNLHSVIIMLFNNLAYKLCWVEIIFRKYFCLIR